jgi:hypothetical protein
MVATFVALALVFSALSAVLFLRNMQHFRAPRFGRSEDVRVAVLIPARNEEDGIRECVKHVLASREVDFDVLVLDDHSSDRTAQIVFEMSTVDNRVNLLHAGPLPRGWNGKQHACWQLSQSTDAALLLFLDADVHVAPWAIARSAAALRGGSNALISGFPRQVTEGVMEWLLLPLIHFVLLGFLPLGRMRSTTDPAYAAGCGQFMVVKREAYMRAGGHAAIRETRHDGLRLPKLFRSAGFHTDIVDLTKLASVRMYRSGGAVWNGLAKNATEGLGSPGRIVPFTLMLTLGQIAPLLLLGLCALATAQLARPHEGVSVFGLDDPLVAAGLALASALAAGLSFLPRVVAAWKYKQPWKSVALHPVGVAVLLLVQWYALLRQGLGRPVGWRQRKYSASTGTEV